MSEFIKWAAKLARAAGAPAAAEDRAQVASGLMSNFAATNKKGELAAPFVPQVDISPEGLDIDVPLPGLVESTMSLPTLLEYIGMGDLVPGWSKEAEAKDNEISAAVHKAMGLKDKGGFGENFDYSLGKMLGQVPLMGKKAVEEGTKFIPKALRAAEHSPAGWLAEYFGPTIRPSVTNYTAGATAGAAIPEIPGAVSSVRELLGLNSPPRDPNEETFDELRSKYSGDKYGGYAEGGKVKGLKNILQHLQDNAGFKYQVYGENPDYYHELIDHPDLTFPVVGSADFHALSRMTENVGNVDPYKIDELYKKYAIPIDPGTDLYRGVIYSHDHSWSPYVGEGGTADEAWNKMFGAGKDVPIGPNPVASVTPDYEMASTFSADAPDRAMNLWNHGVEKGIDLDPDPGAVILKILRQGPLRALPQILSGQAELLVPSRPYDILTSRASMKRTGEAEVLKKAGGGKVAPWRVMDEMRKKYPSSLQKANRLPEGFFSVLEDMVHGSKIDTMPAYQWERALKAGKTVKREDVVFPLKQEELDWSGLSQVLRHDPDRLMGKGDLLYHLYDKYPEFNTNNPGTTFRRYAHDSNLPDRYKETILDLSRTSGGRYGTHYNPETIAHSRSTAHLQPEGDVAKIVDEVQSDRHSAAREKGYNALDWMPDSMFAPEMLDLLRNSRLGYKDPLTGRSPLMDKFDTAAATAPRVPGYEGPHNLNEARERLYELTPPDAPFRDLKDQYKVMLKKEMFDSALDDDASMSLARGKDQKARYGISDPRQVEGMEYSYDKIGPSELEKLARQYGAPYVPAHPVATMDKGLAVARIPSLADAEVERPSQLIDLTVNTDFPYEAFRKWEVQEGYENFVDAVRGLTNEYRTELPDETTEPFKHRINVQFRGMQDLIEELPDSLTDITPDATSKLHKISYAMDEVKAILEGLQDRYDRHQGLRQGKPVDPSSYPTMMLPENIREKIKRVGVSIFNPIVAGAGLAAASRSHSPEEPEVLKKAEGGRVRNTGPIDYAHYGMGPEYGFYSYQPGSGVAPTNNLPTIGETSGGGSFAPNPVGNVPFGDGPRGGGALAGSVASAGTGMLPGLSDAALWNLTGVGAGMNPTGTFGSRQNQIPIPTIGGALSAVGNFLNPFRSNSNNYSTVFSPNSTDMGVSRAPTFGSFLSSGGNGGFSSSNNSSIGHGSGGGGVLSFLASFFRNVFGISSPDGGK